MILFSGYSYKPNIPKMPEIDYLDNLSDIVYNDNIEEQDNNINVTEQINAIDKVIAQYYKRIEWINIFEDEENNNDVVMAYLNIIEELFAIRTEYYNISQYTYREWCELASCAWYEGNSCPLFFKEWVCQVVINRCSSDYFPNNIHDNLIRQGQYNPSYVKIEWIENAKNIGLSWYERDITETNTWEDSLIAAKNAMMGKVDMPENVIFQSNYKSLGDGYWEVYISPFGSYSYFSYKN